MDKLMILVVVIGGLMLKGPPFSPSPTSVLGWQSANQNDDHILTAIQSSAAAELLYIGDDHSLERWKGLNGKFESLGTTFESGFNRLIERVEKSHNT